MPRDANGNYTLPTGNPVVSQTDITSSWANGTMSDLGTEMTDSLSRSGKGGMTGPFPIIDKQGNVPGLSFATEPTSGLKREGAGDMRAQVLGVDKARFTSASDLEVFRNSSWQQVAVTPSGQKAMTGVGGTTVIPMYNATVPPLDWTLEVPDANVRNLVIGGTGGTMAGSDDPTALSVTGISVTITGATESDGAHTHSYSGTTSADTSSQSVTGGTGSASDRLHTHTYSGTTDSSGAHTHGVGTLAGSTAEIAFAPRHAIMILAKLNA